ncbi:MAG: WD40 repeat domain-containing protein [Rhizobiaceae bacterium]
MPTVAPIDLDGHCVTAAFIDDVPVFALADGVVHRLDGGHKWNELHDGLLCADVGQDCKSLITGGEDGRVLRFGADWEFSEIANIGNRWITAVASGPGEATAFASGRAAYAVLSDGTLKEIVHPRSVEDVAFAPKGIRLAVARYNGATLYYPASSGKPTELEWAGAHTGIGFSPNGEFLVSVMQENALHGWKLSDGRHMRMTGYPAKVKSWSWSAKGRWLATSGAPAAIVWPFTGKDGPMGKAPRELGTPGNLMVTAVSCHPEEEVVASGYSDGMVLVCRIGDGNEAVLRRGGRSAISSLCWDKAGLRIAFGTEAGDCGVIDITG